ncbi:aminopeptidase N [Pseudaeromonas paramecii]|uniref:Aminopeptidase N n=1 Tax=Pseudaeromonas paramecii TaxID=2138166 RepID=A0ABP8PU91_9GAMM
MAHLSAPQEKHRLDYQPPHYWIDSIDLDVDLHDSATRVVAISQVRRNGHHNEPLILDGEDLLLSKVAVNGQPWSAYLAEPGKLTLSQLPSEFVLTIETQIDPAGNTALEGLYQSGSAFCTQCEAEGFRRITYYLDRPDVLARFSTRISADKARFPFLLSNGNRTGSGELADGRHWVSWQDPFPKPCYLFALVAGDFDLLQDSFTTRSGRRVALELYVDKGNLDRAGHAMASLKKSMAWDETRFGLEYDLDIYMIVAVDFFNMGAMENKGLNIFNAKFVLANPQTATDTDYFDIERVIGHEYFHNWTGNRVTCRDWFQLSLKEGLTVFRDQEFSSDLGSRGVNRIRNARLVQGPQFAEDAGPMAHPIRPDVVIEMNNFYTLTVYEKGSEVIRMLHTLLGEDAFQAGIRLYLGRHDGQAATCEDFVCAMEEASGRDLKQFRRWYSQAGTPVLTVRDEYDAHQQIYRLHVSQSTPATPRQPEKLPLHIPLSLALYDEQGRVIQSDGVAVDRVLDVQEPQQTFEFTGIGEKPVPALLQEFSAPVKLDYPFSEAQLTLLLGHAQNDYSRWDAAQRLVQNWIHQAVEQLARQQAPAVPVALARVLQQVLQDSRLDAALRAEILTLPSESSLLETFNQVDVDLLHKARQQLLRSLATAMQPALLSAYRSCQQGWEGLSAEAVGQRALAGVCLQLLSLADPALGDELVACQWREQSGMTLRLAALQAANQAQLPCRDALMAEFEAQWHHDGLVMDNWFRLQAQTPVAALTKVRGLLSHPSFSLSNPNRTRALVGTFCSANPVAFHAKDGSGYAFLAEILTELNRTNPQVASRLITPLIQFQRLDNDRQQLARQTLQRLAGLPDLARDLFEKIERALSQ